MSDREHAIPIHTQDDFEAMRRAGRLAARTLDMIAAEVIPGRTTSALNQMCEAFIRDHGGIPAPLGYHGFPYATCMSVNEVVCHGMPDDQPLEDGGLLKVDVTVLLDGWHGDTCRSFVAGKPDPDGQRLLDVTEEALQLGVSAVQPGAPLATIGRAIQAHVETHGFSIVRSHCGHGIGRQFHQPPKVLHHANRERDLVMRPGMFFTIEPMVNQGSYETTKLADGWTIVTTDGRLSAQFEHTVGVTETGVEIFTTSAGS